MARKHTPDAHRWTVADSVTAARMAASLALLFLPVFSASFLTVYTFAGLTDALDGFLARKTGTVSAFAHGWTARRICCFSVFCCSAFFRCCAGRSQRVYGMLRVSFCSSGSSPMPWPPSGSAGLTPCTRGSISRPARQYFRCPMYSPSPAAYGTAASSASLRSSLPCRNSLFSSGARRARRSDTLPSIFQCQRHTANSAGTLPSPLFFCRSAGGAARFPSPLQSPLG